MTEHLYLILFLALVGSAIGLVWLAVHDWFEADRILKESNDDARD